MRYYSPLQTKPLWMSQCIPFWQLASAMQSRKKHFLFANIKKKQLIQIRPKSHLFADSSFFIDGTKIIKVSEKSSGSEISKKFHLLTQVLLLDSQTWPTGQSRLLLHSAAFKQSLTFQRRPNKGFHLSLLTAFQRYDAQTPRHMHAQMHTDAQTNALTLCQLAFSAAIKWMYVQRGVLPFAIGFESRVSRCL